MSQEQRQSSSLTTTYTSQISLYINSSQPSKILVKQDNRSSVSRQDSKIISYRQKSTTLVIGSLKDSNDPSKKSKTNNIKNFKVPKNEYLLKEVAKYNKKEDLQIIVKDIVINVTNQVDKYPSSLQALFSYIGKDTLEKFKILYNNSKEIS